MSFIVEQEGYQYASLVAATVFLMPQIKLATKTKNLKELSTSSMVLIVFGSSLWAFYMYENSMLVYAALTTFVGLNAVVLLFMQMYYYYNRVNEHMQSFDQPPGPALNINIPSQNETPNSV